MSHLSKLSQRKQIIGIDLGDKYSYLHSLDQETGESLNSSRIETSAAAFELYFLSQNASHIVIEAGVHSPWVNTLLSRLGHEVIVANPSTLALIHSSAKKNDELDAEKLARLGRFDPSLLNPIQHRSQQVRADRAQLKARSVLVTARTQLINHVRGIVKSFGAKVPKCSSASFHKLAAQALPAVLKETVNPLLRSIEQLSKEIKLFDKQLAELSKTRYKATKLLRQVEGVGPLLSLAFVLTLEKPERFHKSRDVAAYLGLLPKQRQSGDRDPSLGISKRGDRFLRHLLIQSAQFILCPLTKDSDLKRFGQALTERGGSGAKQRAVVAVARKLASLLHHLWVTGEVYDPQYQLKRAAMK